MCGIIGYVGPRPAGPILLEGLKRLEYRGYDSAGLAVLENGGLAVEKRPGKIAELEDALDGRLPVGSCGIAHTRWATHGPPNRMNAHPQLSADGDIALVHNGIVESAARQRPRLRELGFEFRSETDTEVLVHLIDLAFRDCEALEDAVAAALAQIEGTYGIAVVSSRDPGKIVVARHGSPVLLGIGQNDELFVASDAAAVVAHTRKVVRLRDGDSAVLTREGYRTFDPARRAVRRGSQIVNWDVRKIGKGGYDHYMYKEIREQPSSLRDVMRGRLLEDEGMSRLGGITVSDPDLQAVDRIVITACGTSWHAGLIGGRMIEDMARIPVTVEYASEFRYRNPVLSPGTLVMGISQSGETADTLAALREARRRGCRIMGIVNVVGSSIALETDFGVYLHAGPEIGVASTKAFSSQVVALALVTLYLARRRNMSLPEGRRLVRALQALPDQVEEVLEADDRVAELARKYGDAPNFLYLGRGHQFPVALEGALKLKEVSYIHAEGYPAAEMKHGPIALIDENMPVVVLAPRDVVYPKTLSNIEEVRARHGRVIAVVNDRNSEVVDLVDDVILVPRTIPALMPVLTTVPLQLLAYHIAVMRGCDVDQPRNLAKSVTVE
ncbi:MAG: glutamine--fructose-6-phosphate transaminase (isomerizing) [Gemmatimonadota bacterium]|nr:glutamine--fructose-6-phosphate transaminase (isomerizing) [Gemmatimonadota bacterium]MDE2866181.1 glutamine--fructose-6-phosphate transaminase (isomerizing) [Gemmatimonadota bacterium]MXV95583.1 glutamine--fructose-6-phosphate transaminase (isomerizing) [Gemmatimonadota bacterium]MYB07674.1 glutamine--fructose-6-phosphate transaminase (isomerizing) [Gemmatimonadota bacterium]MYE16059.1 glutamine--fructose-6-phosphate transaminase (isomerizing) [Gemmatimonadota bacterium]